MGRGEVGKATGSKAAGHVSRAAWTRLLDKDLFGRVRTDGELASLVLSAARHSPTPYSVLVGSLLGRPGYPEAGARDLWMRAVEHRRRLADAVGRPVHLRVAALDLVLTEDSAGAPVVLDRELVRRLVIEATSDALTGLPNRRHLLTVLEHEMRQRRPPVVVMVDVDRFKHVNDTLGHARGDDVLRGLADILRANRRTGDVAARLGGDEFAMLLVDSTGAVAESVMRRVQRAFVQAFGPLGVSLSFGIAQGGGGASAAEVLAEADRLMYAAKRAGPPPLATPPPVVLYATTSSERFAAFHALFAERGVMAVPANAAEVARLVAPVLSPQVILADVMLPPRGGATLLRELSTGLAPPFLYLVAPEQWRGVRRSAPGGFEALAYPPSPGMVARVTSRLASGPTGRLPGLGSRENALQLIGAVARLVRGEDRPGVSAAWSRPELDLLRKLLGT